MHPIRTLVLAVLCGALALAVPATGTASAADDPVVRTVTVSGDGAGTYPAYRDDVDRFAVTTTEATGGVLTVQAATTDPGGTVRINGQEVEGGTSHEVTGLSPGDEVNVQISDSSGHTNQSWFYLPPTFPELTTTTAGEGPAPGQTLLTLSAPGGASLSTAVDRHGVPSFVLPHPRGTANLALQPDGGLAVALALHQDDIWGDWEVRRLDAQHRLHSTSYRMLGQPRTDFHDFILLPGGGRILMAYTKRDDGQSDSRLQEVAPDGTVLLDWNSADHVDETVDPLTNGLGDYAHLNSIEVMDDGDLLMSFRHLSQVMKVDRTTGEVRWRLGGVRSDFTFPDDPLGGPCAQHTARELTNGDIQIYDNGSVAAEPMCPDPADPDGPRIARPASRVTVYRLDEANGTAALVEQRSTGSFNRYAGSAQRLGGGDVGDHLLMGVTGGIEPDLSQAPDAIELSGDGDVVWSLAARDSSSYRALRAPVPDATPPLIHVRGLTDGARLVEDTPRVVEQWCTDTGGSNLASCTGTRAGGQALDLSPGQHRITLQASDRGGNTSTRQLDYTVRAAHQPDVSVRRGTRGTWVGSGVTDPRAPQQVSVRLARGKRATTYLRVRNSGARAERIRVVGTRGTARYSARWWHGRTDVTRQVTNGTRTPVLAPGQTRVYRVVVRRSRSAPAGSGRTFVLRATSVHNPKRVDAAGVRVLAR